MNSFASHLNSNFSFHINPPSKEDVQLLMQACDTNKNGKLDVHEFEELVSLIFSPKKAEQKKCGNKATIKVVPKVIKSFLKSAVLLPFAAHTVKRGIGSVIGPPWSILVQVGR